MSPRSIPYSTPVITKIDNNLPNRCQYLQMEADVKNNPDA